MADLLHADSLRENLEGLIELKNFELEKLYGWPRIDVGELFETVAEFGRQLEPYVDHTGHILDEALLRPGRFDRIIRIPQPDAEARLKILNIHSRSMSLTRGLSLKKLVKETEGMSGADLRALCVEAGMAAIQDDRTKVRASDFRQALQKLRSRLSEAELDEPEQTLYY